MLRFFTLCLVLLALMALVGCGGSDTPSGGGGGEVVQTALPGVTVRTTRAVDTQVVTLAPETLSSLVVGVYGAPVTYLGYAPLELTGDAWPRVTGTINVGDGPLGVAFAPGGTVAYVTNSNADTVSVINVATGSVGSPISVGDGPFGVAFAPGGAIAYVANSNADTVSVINVATHTVVGSPINVGDEPVGVAFAPDGRVAYVTNYYASTVSVIDVATGSVTGTIPVGGGPRGVAFTPDGAWAYVANGGSDTVSVINVSSGAVTGTLNVGDDPIDVAFGPDGTVAYVTNFESDTVNVIDVADRTVMGTLSVGDGPWGVAFAPDGRVAYVANRNSDTVSVIDVAGGSVMGTLNVGDGPYGVAFAPNGRVAYVVNYGSDTASKIERSGQRVFIGPNGTDQGFNPPFGFSRAGVLMSWGRKQQPPWVLEMAPPELRACLMVDMPTAERAMLNIELRGGVLATAVLTAPTLSKLWLDQGPGRAVRKIIDYDGGIFPIQYGYPSVLVQFDMATGKVFAVTPTKSRFGRSGEPPYGIEEEGDFVRLRGDFAGVYAVQVDANVAPEGATAVTIERKTGRIVDLKR